MIKLHPLRDMLVMVQAKMPEKIGSLFLGERQRKSLPFGRVVEVGPDVKHIKVGDHVFFDPVANVAFPHEDEMAILVREEGVYCTVEGDFSQVVRLLTSQVN